MNEQFDEFSGSLTLDALEFNTDAIPSPDTLYIHMTRDKREISNEIRKQFGGFERVIIDVDGEQHEFGADSFIQMLEDYEDAQGMNNYMTLFGTPEKTARTLEEFELDNFNWCRGTNYCEKCPYEFDRYGCYLPDGFSLLKWLRSDVK